MAILVMFPPLSIPLSISRWQGQDHRGAVAATGELTMENPCWIKPPANHASFFHCPVRQVVSDVFWMYSLTFLNVFPHVFSEICYQRWGNHRSSHRCVVDFRFPQVQCSFDEKLQLCRNQGIHTVGCASPQLRVAAGISHWCSKWITESALR